MKPSLPLHVRPQEQIRTRNAEKWRKLSNLIILLRNSVHAHNSGQRKPNIDRCVYSFSSALTHDKHPFTSCNLSSSTACHVCCVPSGNFGNQFPSCPFDFLMPHNSDLQTSNFLFQLPIFFLKEGAEECQLS